MSSDLQIQISNAERKEIPSQTARTVLAFIDARVGEILTTKGQSEAKDLLLKQEVLYRTLMVGDQWMKRRHDRNSLNGFVTRLCQNGNPKHVNPFKLWRDGSKLLYPHYLESIGYTRQTAVEEEEDETGDSNAESEDSDFVIRQISQSLKPIAKASSPSITTAAASIQPSADISAKLNVWDENSEDGSVLSELSVPRCV